MGVGPPRGEVVEVVEVVVEVVSGRFGPDGRAWRSLICLVTEVKLYSKGLCAPKGKENKSDKALTSKTNQQGPYGKGRDGMGWDRIGWDGKSSQVMGEWNRPDQSWR